MPDLLQSLEGHDLGHLRIVAGLWGFELRSRDFATGSEELAVGMLDARLAGEVIESLGQEPRAALQALAQAGGRIPWAVFIRRFGDVREMGAGRRDRELPHLKPASAAEILFYRALLGRAFFETENGAQEFAYIPDNLLPFVAQGASHQAESDADRLGHAASPAERSHTLQASDGILDDATTLLAALRIGHPMAPDPVLGGLLEAARILQNGSPQAAKVKSFLEVPRADALRLLVEAWRSSEQFDELRLLPDLVCEGEWANQPRATRVFILGRLDALPRQTWWSLNAFIAGVKQHHPDFQRPAGDYDSWFIRSLADGSYLRGFSNWERVDGALIRFLISDVMHRLGLLDLAAPAPDMAPSAIRLPAEQDQSSRFDSVENGKLHVSSQGRLAASPLVPRAVRYQLARFCEWDEEAAGEYRYHVSPQSLERAAKQGLKVEHLVALLAKHASAGVPAAVSKALTRWEKNGTEARTETQVVLRVRRPEILGELRRSKAARFLDRSLGPTAVSIKSGAQAKVIAALVELGILAQDDTIEIGGTEGDTPSAPPAKGIMKSGSKLTSRR